MKKKWFRWGLLVVYSKIYKKIKRDEVNMPHLKLIGFGANFVILVAPSLRAFRRLALSFFLSTAHIGPFSFTCWV